MVPIEPDGLYIHSHLFCNPTIPSRYEIHEPRIIRFMVLALYYFSSLTFLNEITINGYFFFLLTSSFCFLRFFRNWVSSHWGGPYIPLDIPAGDKFILAGALQGGSLTRCPGGRECKFRPAGVLVVLNSVTSWVCRYSGTASGSPGIRFQEPPSSGVSFLTILWNSVWSSTVWEVLGNWGCNMAYFWFFGGKYIAPLTYGVSGCFAYFGRFPE